MSKTDIDAMRKSNRPGAEQVEGFLTRIEKINTDIQNQRMANMRAMKPHYEDRGEIYKQAKEQGIHTKALKGLVSARAALQKLITKADNMDDTTGDEYSHMADQIELFAVVPMSPSVQKAHDAELAAKDAEIKALNAKIEALTEEAGEKVKPAEDPAADKPKLKAVT